MKNLFGPLFECERGEGDPRWRDVNDFAGPSFADDEGAVAEDMTLERATIGVVHGGTPSVGGCVKKMGERPSI